MPSFRKRSHLQLARFCGINELHALTAGTPALDLFDSAKTRNHNLHILGERERELPEYAEYDTHDRGLYGFSRHFSGC